MAATAFILLPPRKQGYAPQGYWIHWPGLAVSNRELTAEWCSQNWMPNLEDNCEAIAPRNISSYVPMYGCAISAEEPPMLVHWVVDANGHLHEDWSAWLQKDPEAATLSSLFHIGHRRMWPGQKDLDPSPGFHIRPWKGVLGQIFPTEASKGTWFPIANKPRVTLPYT